MTASKHDLLDMRWIDSAAAAAPRANCFTSRQSTGLRVYVNVPQVYSPHIKPGLKAELTAAPNYPGRHFKGSSFGTAGQSTTRQRTLLHGDRRQQSRVELKPGGYAEVHLNLPSAVTTFTLR